MKDCTGKLIDITPGVVFLARDRNARVFEYEYSGVLSGYELLLKNKTDNTDTWVVPSWFSERHIEVLHHSGHIF
jgi:hypothetical protein